MAAPKLGPVLTRITIERRELADGSDVVVGAVAEDVINGGLPEIVTTLGMIRLGEDSLMREYMGEIDDE